MTTTAAITRVIRAFSAAAFSVIVMGDSDGSLYRDAGVVTRH
ncbi:hypothetical protein OKJ48_01805 [Streptomyces kunmingensis]|uniref:Uncharacterized protein n=1 Tax=Streptomyces kunmingensis TaxID=68225 RepID=A0ABU6C484_9ACTN|nr:hypothetical protein [Streptomyces kunmingensis]MEB3958997.1 hypothetical protein [Streptomyces kunmingensis]